MEEDIKIYNPNGVGGGGVLTNIRFGSIKKHLREMFLICNQNV